MLKVFQVIIKLYRIRKYTHNIALLHFSLTRPLIKSYPVFCADLNSDSSERLIEPKREIVVISRIDHLFNRLIRLLYANVLYTGCFNFVLTSLDSN